MKEVDHVVANDAKLKPESFAAVTGIAPRDRPAIAEPAGPTGALQRAFVAGSERLRSSLYFLHHSLWPWRVALATGRGNRGPDCGTRRAGFSGSGSEPAFDIASYGRDLPHKPHARWHASRDPCRIARSAAPAPVLARSRCHRQRSVGPDRARTPPDAASASQSAGGRRHDPQTHEAPSFGRGCAPPCRSRAPPAPGHRFRRGHHCRLSHRNRPHGQKHVCSCRTMRPHLAAYLSLFSSQGHTRRPACRKYMATCAVRGAEKLRALGEKAAAAHLRSLVGKTIDVLVERTGSGPEASRACSAARRISPNCPFSSYKTGH